MGQLSDADVTAWDYMAIVDEGLERIREGLAAEIWSAGVFSCKGRGHRDGDAPSARIDYGGGVVELAVDVACVEPTHRSSGSGYPQGEHPGGENSLQPCVVRMQVHWEGLWPGCTHAEAVDSVGRILQAYGLRALMDGDGLD